MSLPPAVLKIISGGQTGVDRAALDVALESGIPCGGWCPRGRRAEDGVIPAKYPLQETASEDYAERTRLNVLDSDGTLILIAGTPDGGTALTVRIARENARPHRVVELGHPPDARDVLDWIRDHRIRTLNIAGPREEEHPGIQERATGFLLGLLSCPTGMPAS